MNIECGLYVEDHLGETGHNLKQLMHLSEPVHTQMDLYNT